MSKNDRKQLHVAMYPWLAMGHLTSFLHVSNKLAGRHGHRVSFFVPTGETVLRLTPLNRHPDLITFVPFTVPSVPGLPPSAATTNDLPFPLHHLLFAAMDQTAPALQASLAALKPDIVFFDFAHWLPAVARLVLSDITTVHYCTISPATVGFLLTPERPIHDRELTDSDLLTPPKTFPASSAVKLSPAEARALARATKREFAERIVTSMNDCHVIAFKASTEMEGAYCDYVERVFRRPVLLAGPVLPEPPAVPDAAWDERLSRFGPSSVVFCCFGSECVLSRGQFEELVLGVESTGLPFLIALKPPLGFDTIEAALPDGFGERVSGRGIVTGEWVLQSVILRHASVGCFVTHCGSGSLLEGLVSKCRLVLVPNVGDQIVNARVMGGDLGVGVEVVRDGETGLFTRDGICDAVNSAMSSQLVGERHARWREFLLRDGLEDSYIDAFVEKLLTMAKKV